MGSIVGAFCGDALGGPLEFKEGPIKRELVEKAMALEGEGPHNLQPGQITDDSEMALCVAHGINNMPKPEEEFDVKFVVEYYAKWMKSPPFDIGYTTHNALKSATIDKPNPDNVRKDAKGMEDSQSNGCLMRITPLGVYVSKIEKIEKLEEVVRAEISLTHANKVVQNACICYCIALKELIANWEKDERRDIAYNAAYTWAEKKDRTVLKWFTPLKKNLPNANKQSGWAKIAFAYAFYYLKEKMEYRTAIEEMITKGGDTDTNAAIVGGLIGAAEGYSNIPKEISDKMLTCNSCNSGHKRPEFLCPLKFDLLKLIEKIFNCRPTSPTVVN